MRSRKFSRLKLCERDWSCTIAKKKAWSAAGQLCYANAGLCTRLRSFAEVILHECGYKYAISQLIFWANSGQKWNFTFLTPQAIYTWPSLLETYLWLIFQSLDQRRQVLEPGFLRTHLDLEDWKHLVENFLPIYIYFFISLLCIVYLSVQYFFQYLNLVYGNIYIKSVD